MPETAHSPGRRALHLSLTSRICPACGKPKPPKMSLCRADYFALPRTLQISLYDRMGDGYEEAMRAALSHLGATRFYSPEEAQG